MSSLENVRTCSIINTLNDRELGRGKGPAFSTGFMSIPGVERRIDTSFNDISKCVKKLIINQIALCKKHIKKMTEGVDSGING